MIFNNYSELMKSFPALDDKARIELQIEVNNLLRKAKMGAKQKSCLCCGKKVESFCNSHSVPKFCLKNISVNGEVFYSNTLIEIPIFNGTQGNNSAGTFHLVCNDCDGKLFNEYESPENLIKKPTSKILSEIALKNYLKLIYKKFVEKKLYCLLEDKFGIDFSTALEANRLGTINYNKGLEKAKRLAKKEENDGYYLFYYQILDYRVPVAFQSAVTLLADMNGALINEVYNMNSNYRSNELQMAVFPLKEKSIVIMFIDNNVKKYKKFMKQFEQLNSSERLGVFNYIMFLYSEDYFLSKQLNNKLDLNCLKLVSGKSLDGFRFEDESPYPSALNEFDLSKWKSIPNLLDVEYAIG